MDFLPSKDGQFKIPLLHSHPLCSLYNPLKEAKRFFSIKGLKLKLEDEAAKPLLILGDFGGFLTRYAQPSANQPVCVVLESEKQKQIALDNNADCSFSNENLFYFGVDNFKLPPIFVERGWQTLIWEPAVAQSQLLTSFLSNLPIILQRQMSSTQTNQYFALRWAQNSYQQLLWHSHWYSLQAVKTPICIVAPGNSLRKQIPFLKKNRSHLLLLAMTSALEALEEAQLFPDLLIQTDASYWSKRFLLRSHRKYPIIAPMTAAPFRNHPWIPLLQENPLDELYEKIAPTSSSKLLKVPETGSVACTALKVAQSLTNNKIFFAGLDLQSEKELPHIMSHDSLIRLNCRSHRLSPLQNLLYHGEPSQTEQSLNVYQKWFIDEWNTFPTFFRLEGSAENALKNIISFQEAESYLSSENDSKWRLIPIYEGNSSDKLRRSNLFIQFLNHNQEFAKDFFDYLNEAERKALISDLSQKLKKFPLLQEDTL